MRILTTLLRVIRIITTLLIIVRIITTLFIVVRIVVGIVVVITLKEVVLCFRLWLIVFIGPIDSDDVENSAIFLLWSGLKVVAFEPSHIPGVKCMIIVLRVDHDHGIAGAILSVPDEHSCSSPFSVFGWMLTATLECAGNAECLCKFKPFRTLSGEVFTTHS